MSPQAGFLPSAPKLLNEYAFCSSWHRSIAICRSRPYTAGYVHMLVSPPTTWMRDIVDPPSPACACGRLRRATRALTQLYDDAMAPVGLRVTQFSLLRTLARDGPLRISELAERQLLDRTALSRNLDPLVDHGYIEIIRGDDARTREVAITKNGKSTLNRAEPCWTQAQKAVAKRLGAERLDALIATLGELESLHPSNRPSPRPSPRFAGRGSPSSHFAGKRK
jgi:DNA-binding MarR family transcriptional regulator